MRVLAFLLTLLAHGVQAAEPLNLTRHTGDHYDPSWSSDSQSVLFESTCNPRPNPGWQMQRVRADGSGQTSTLQGRVDFRPVMSPDGKRIAFDSARDGNHEIYVAGPDGSNAIRLTNDPAYDSAPRWSPDGEWLVFFSGPAGLGGEDPRRTYGNAELWIMRPDGTARRRLTTNEFDDVYPHWSPDGKSIAFTSYRDGNAEIYTIAPDGSAERRLTNSPARDDGASWSADSSALSFTSTRDGNYEIYVMRADGSHPTNVTRHPAQDAGSAWSPDGRWLAFSSKRGGNWDIYRIGAPRPAADRSTSSAVSGTYNLTQDPSGDLHPSWSPDGRSILVASDRGQSLTFRDTRLYLIDARTRRATALPHVRSDTRASFSPDGQEILFESDRDGDTDLYVMRAGSDSTRTLIDAPGTQSWGRWSPDGKQIVFSSAEGSAASDLFLVQRDGSGKINLTNHAALDSAPTWAPDGKRIAFVSDRDGNLELYLLDLESRTVRRLTDEPAPDLAPAWSPDGKQIAFMRSVAGRADIHIMTVETGAIRNVTDDEAWDHYPAWAPDSCRLAFVSKRTGDLEVWVTDLCAPAGGR